MPTENREVLSRRARPPDAVLRYGDHRDQVADLRLPPGPARTGEPAPLVVVVHGGFWRAEYDRAHAGPQSAALAAAGYAVASIEYRRVATPGGGLPGTFDDVAAAVDTVPRLAAAAAPGRVDAGRTVLVGHSAGGHLALWAAARHRLPAGSRWHAGRAPGLRGVVALGAVTDLVAAEAADLGDGAVRDLLGGPATAHPEADPARLLPTGVPTVLVHGVDDAVVPAEQSRTFAGRARAAGQDVGLDLLPGTGHFALIDPRSAAWVHVPGAVARCVGGLTRLA